VADCLFCRIATGELASEVLFDSPDVMAFRDINPAAPTHVLVVPKRHIASASELSREHGRLIGEMFEIIGAIADREDLDGGYRVVANVGPDAGQSVHHVHFHVIGGRRMAWPPG
jgi:histidine triad (HIT) family protein